MSRMELTEDERFVNVLVDVLYECSQLEPKTVTTYCERGSSLECEKESKECNFYVNDICYKLVCNFSNIEKDLESEPDEIRSKVCKMVKDMNCLVFPSEYKVILANCCDFDCDDTDIKLDFHKKWKLDKNNVVDLVEGLYKIKKHKFDKNYECFSILRLNSCSNVININIRFVH